MNQDTIETTLSHALNQYQHLPVHLPGSRGLSASTATSNSVPPNPSTVRPNSNPPPGPSSGANGANGVAPGLGRMVKPTQKLGAKKRSWVWNWFVQDLDDANVAVCDQCGKIIHRLPSDKGSPKKLSEHLRTHKIDKMTGNPGRDHMIGILSLPVSSASASSTDSAMSVGNKSKSKQQGVNSQRHNAQPPASMTLKSVNPGGLGHIPQHLLAEFDISQYSQIKFHKDIMRFLTDNKLPISVVKSPSFRQMVFTLRPESLEDLNELNNIYASLMEVLKNNDSSSSSPTSQPTNGPVSATDKANWI